MQFNSAFGFSKPRPWENRKTQVYSGRIKCIHSLIQLKAEVFVRIQLPGFVDQYLCKITIYAPISIFIGISYCAARDIAPDTHMVKLFSHCPKTAFNVTQAFSIGELSKCHAQKLIKAYKRANTLVTVIPVNTLTKFVFGQKVNNLRKNRLAMVHVGYPSA